MLHKFIRKQPFPSEKTRQVDKPRWGGITNYHMSMITYCPLQRHLVDSHSKGGSSSCQNVSKFSINGCFLL